MRPASAYPAMMAAAAVLLLISCSAAAAGAPSGISVNQNGSFASLSVPAPAGSSVVWDFGDGAISKGASTAGHTWQPGFYRTAAAVLTRGGAEYHEVRLGTYDDSPGAVAHRNSEYRYAVYNGPDPKLVVTDAGGDVASWLSYDPAYRIVTGVPRDTGAYHAVLTGDRTIEWDIMVYDGSAQSPWVRFSASVEGDAVKVDSLYLSTEDSTVRYSWSLAGLDGELISAFEGRTPAMQAAPGTYILTLKASGISGAAMYRQMVHIPASGEGQESGSFAVPPALIIAATVLAVISLFKPNIYTIVGCAACLVAAGVMIL